MDLNYSAEDRAFRDDIKDFIASELPDDLRDKVRLGLKIKRDDTVRWQKILNAKGWVAPEWPEEFGGNDWSVVQRYIFKEELTGGHAPELVGQGPRMVGPVIYTFGDDAQKARYLDRILAADDIWCQGYSEPGSGSDLASLQTRAVLDGDRYIVNGTKMWTSHAHYADMMFCLCRTDPDVKFQEGISFLLIDMTSPGVEVKPVPLMEGTHHVNMVYLTDVEVPVENRVGEENRGWTYAKYLLRHERTGIARVGISKSQLAKLKKIAAVESKDGAALIDDPDFRREIALAEMSLKALEISELRALMATAKGDAPGAEASTLKIRGTEVQQRLFELLMKTVGYYAQPDIDEAREYGWNEPPIGSDYSMTLGANYFVSRRASIVGGTNEIQRNIISKMVLGL